MGGSQSTRLVQPEVLRDEANARQPSASRKVKERLVQMASDDDYEPHMQMLSAANPEVATMLGGSVGHQLVEEAAEFDGTSPAADDEDDEDDDDDEVDSRKRLKKSATVEFLLCVMMRLGNMHVMPFFVAIMSVVALKSGMSEDNWSVLMLLSAQFNERWVQDFCVMLSAVVARETEGVHSTHIRLAVFDNCSYMRRNKFQSEESDGGMIHTVNWMRLPLDAARFGAQVARGMWHNGSRTFLCRRLFAPKHPRAQRFLLDTWLSMVQLAMRLKREDAGADEWTLLLLTRPSSHTATTTFTIYMDPVLNVGTAAYADVDLVLKVIFNFYFITCVMPAAIVLLVGDQQSYNRMIWQKKLSPKLNDWYVPLPGEFHFVVHVLMAIHRLWFVALSSWANDALGWHKTIKEDWTSVEEWHHYDRFYQLLIAVLTAYLLEIVPSRMLLQPVLLRDAVAGNASASMIVRFLFEFGHPYLALRNAIRANDHASSAVNTRTHGHARWCHS